MKKVFIIALISIISLQAHAFEEVILSTDGKISNIKIKDTSVININPLRTIQNKKNILFISPIKIGETSFSLLKNGKEEFSFNVIIEENKTIVETAKGFEITSLNVPPEILDCEIDQPPVFNKKQSVNIDGAIIEIEDGGEIDG